MVQSKDKVIKKLKDKTFKPEAADTKTFHMKVASKKTGGKEVLRCTELVIGYNGGSQSSPVRDDLSVRDDSPVYAGKDIARISLIVNRGDRLAVIGANGTGKSTFIKTIVGVLPKISGEYSYGHEIEY